MEIIANVLLFLSALVLLIDFAPFDSFPINKQRNIALGELLSKKNLIIKSKGNINIVPGSSTLSISESDEHCVVLFDFIRLLSPIKKYIDWSRVVGVGYSTISNQFGNEKLDAFKVLYLSLIPIDESTSELELLSIGYLEDIFSWFDSSRKNQITRFALLLLFIGFFLQLLTSIQK